MLFRASRRVRVAEVGQVTTTSRARVVGILTVPVVSLVLPALAVALASAGGTSQVTSIAAAVARFLLFYSGVFALVALTAAVAAGLLATDRVLMSPDRRILAQALHRTMSLIGIAALANHIMLEVLANRAGIIDGFVPFMAARSTFYMGLGTLSSDLFVVIIVTGMLRRRFTSGARRWLWRSLHATAYAAWPLAVLHGLMAGRSARPYVDWCYGGCLALVGLALTVRYIAVIRGRNGAAGAPARSRPAAPWRGLPPGLPAGQLAELGPAVWPGPALSRSQPARPLRAIPAAAIRPGFPPAGRPGYQPDEAATDPSGWTAAPDARAWAPSPAPEDWRR
jgi:hypothetical protein